MDYEENHLNLGTSNYYKPNKSFNQPGDPGLAATDLAHWMLSLSPRDSERSARQCFPKFFVASIKTYSKTT